MDAKKTMSMIVATALLWAWGARAAQVDLQVAVSHPVLLAGAKRTAYLKVGLTGLPAAGERERAPVNVAIVLDRSGSMSGAKMRKAKEAAILAVERLGPRDIVSVVAYNHNVTVLVPATRVADKHAIYSRIGRLHAGGSTALFAGVSKGAHEVRKFISQQGANRVVLVSDGLANVGPSSPSSLAALGASLGEEGIPVTTIGLGLGYNEDLMFQLAHASDGNHVFVERSSELAGIFSREFGDLLSVVAGEVELAIECPEGIRPVRVLGREADIAGQRVVARLNGLFAEQEKYILLEVEVDPSEENQSRSLAEVEVAYFDMIARERARRTGRASVVFTGSAAAVRQATNREVMVAVVEQIAAENNMRAMSLRDRGRVTEARKALLDNQRYLDQNADRYRSRKLRFWGRKNLEDADNLSPDKWKKRRKAMREMQFDMMH